MRPSFAFLAAVAASLIAATPAAQHYPKTPVIPVTENYSGTQVVDPYRWLEDDNSPQVVAWVKAQDAVARSFIEEQPSYRSYSVRVAALSKSGIYRYGLTIRQGHLIYFRDMPPEAQPELVTRDGLHGAERVLFNPNAAAPHGQAAPSIESVFVSPDGSKVAFTTQLAGAEEETLRVLDVSTSKLLPDVIDHAGGGTTPTAVIWDHDGGGFIHTRFPLSGSQDERHFNIKLYHHTLGADPAADPYVFGNGQVRNVEYYAVQSLDTDAVALFVDAGDGVFATVYTKYGDGPFRKVADPSDAINCCESKTPAAFVGGALYVESTKQHSNGDIYRIPEGKTLAQGTRVVPAGRYSIDTLTAVQGGFITSEIDGGDSVAQYYAADGRHIAIVPLPALSLLNGIAADPRGGDIIVRYQSYDTPGRWLAYDAASNRLARTGVEDRVPGDYSGVTARRVFAPSLDGSVKIPLEIVTLKGTKPAAATPTLMTAYGSYGIVSSPFFVGPLLAWLERGGVFAQAMIRGGGEYGEGWHGMAVHATVYKRADDLAACARWLAANGYGDRHHLGILGGSAGGYLMGLALTRNPELYRAVNSDVGFYSELREVLTPNGVFNIPEFGDPKNPKQFPWVYEYSPYYHVRDKTPYPAVLMETGENDPRVAPRESRKMTARLQAATTSGYPVLLWQKSGAGHGIGSSLDQRIAQLAEELTFLESQLRK